MIVGSFKKSATRETWSC